MTLPGAYVSLPQVLLDDKPSELVSTNTLSAVVEETIQGLYRCEITLNNYGADGYFFLGRDVLDFGQDIALRLGPGEQSPPVFKGRIMGLEAVYPAGGGARLIVLAEDRLQDLRMTRRSRSFEDVTDAEVIEQIASEHGLQSDVSLDGPVHRILAQVNQSDLAFVRKQVRMLNAELWLEDKKLFVSSRQNRGQTEIGLIYGASLTSFSVRADLAHQCTSLQVTGWNVAAKDSIKGVGDTSSINRELNGNISGSEILQASLGARTANIVHAVPLTELEATHIARARYQERARRFVVGTGVTAGDRRIRVGITLNFSGLGQMFNGSYYVTRVCHRYDGARGFQTEFDVERAGIG